MNPTPRTSWASLFWPPVLAASFVADLYVLAHIGGFRPHGVTGYAELAAFITAQMTFFWFGAQSLLMFHIGQKRPAHHSLHRR